MRNTLRFLVFSLILWASCMPYEERRITNIELDLGDKQLQKILDFQDQRLTDSLVTFFDNPNANYRYTAALALASSKDKTGLKDLYDLLDDEVDDVRAAAAYAIGQIGDSTSTNILINAFDNNDSLRLHEQSNAQILEATGKCGGEFQVRLLSSIKTYREADTLLLLGQTRGLYRAALRGIIAPQGTRLMQDYTLNKSYPTSVRKMAGHYLHRAKNLQLDSTVLDLCQALEKEENPEIRMTWVTAIAKSKMIFAKDTLLNHFAKESDYRVKVNLLRALSFFEYPDVSWLPINALNDKNPHVAYAAADYLYRKGTSEDGKAYRALARQMPDENWRVKAKLYAASSKNLSYFYTQAKSTTTGELINWYKRTDNLNAKSAILDAMSEFEWAYPQVAEFGLKQQEPALKSAGAYGLVKILESENFDNTFQLGKRRTARTIKKMLLDELRQKDPAVKGIVSTAIANPDNDFKDYFAAEETGYKYLDTVLMEMKLPQDIEAYKELEKAIALMKGEKVENPTKPEFNHPIDWEMADNLNERVRGVIQTNKGQISLEFFHHQAPATVVNFIRLTKDKYYDGKSIHRVVPNFVIQGGCDRGDGWGSQDYSIRSELPFLYYDAEGYIGMASAGNDTESGQWFITHSATPHLDGNYTIFGRVKSGMDVVHQIEPGDIIEKAVIKF